MNGLFGGRERVVILLKKNKNFFSDEYVCKYNKKREKIAKLLLILVTILNIVIFNINSINKSNLEKNFSDDSQKEDPVVETNSSIKNIDKVGTILKRVETYDFFYDGDNLSFKVKTKDEKSYLRSLAEIKNFTILSMEYDNENDFIKIKGELK